LTLDADIRFPGESSGYRRARNRLLEVEVDLRRAIESVAAQRRALPPGGEVPAVVAKADPERIRTFAQAETAEGEQIPILNVFERNGSRLRHSWATELRFAPRAEGEEPRYVDSIWPIWNVLDMTPEGRGTEPDFPGLQDE
jgi:predicted dithiol-disulfide oxidoreductase (DUF899 family)